MSERVQSKDLKPGTIMIHRDGKMATLDCRKVVGDRRDRQTPFWPGWWLTNNDGGLADFVIDADDPDWIVESSPGEAVRAALLGAMSDAYCGHEPEDMAYVLDALLAHPALIEGLVAMGVLAEARSIVLRGGNYPDEGGPTVYCSDDGQPLYRRAPSSPPEPEREPK